MTREKAKSRQRKGRSRVLYRMTAFLVILFILAAAAIFFSHRVSQNKQIQESTDTLMASHINNVADSYEFINRLLSALTVTLFPEIDAPQSIDALPQEQQTSVQGFLDERLTDITDAGVLGSEISMALLMPSSQVPQPVVVASSDEGLIYQWEMPDYLVQAIQDGEAYLYLPDGMPELGLDDETLVLFNMGELPSPDFPLTFVNIVSLNDELAAINSFYAGQRKDAAIALGLILLIDLVLLSILSYLGLAYLIRKRINEPIDELAVAAAEVAEGNLDVEIEIRRGEDFEGLKYAFRSLVGSFRIMLSKSVGESELGEEKESQRPRKVRLKVLYQMTAFLVILFILSGLAIFFSFRGIRERQFDESVDYLITDYAESASEAYDHLSQLFADLAAATLPPFDPEEPTRALREKLITPTVVYYNEWMKRMIDEGFMELDLMFAAALPSPLVPEPLVFTSSDESLVYTWEIPGYILEAVEDDKSYLYLPAGIPELGMNDETLVYMKATSGFDSVYVAIAPFHDKVATINEFYDRQKRNSAVSMALIMLISAIVLSLLSFFGLRYLIHKYITRPIDELSAVADKLMEGDLDVEIEIQEGEEFEGLKYAFRELLYTINNLIIKSIDDEGQ